MIFERFFKFFSFLAVSFRKKRECLKDFFFFFQNGAKFPPKKRIVSGISLSVFFLGGKIWQLGEFFSKTKKKKIL